MKIKNTLHDFKHGKITGITLDLDQSFILWRYGGGMISHFTIAVLTKVYLWLGSYELP